MRERVLKSGDAGENFGYSDEKVSWSLSGDVDVIWFFITRRWAFEWGGIAGSRVINRLLHHRCVSHGECGKDEARGDASDRVELEAPSSKERIEAAVHYGD